MFFYIISREAAVGNSSNIPRARDVKLTDETCWKFVTPVEKFEFEGEIGGEDVADESYGIMILPG